MTTTSPAGVQPALTPARGGGHKGDARGEAGAAGFGKFMSAGNADEARTVHGGKPGDDGNPNAAPEKSVAARHDPVARAHAATKPKHEQGDDASSETDDSRGAMLALLPLLSAAELRHADSQPNGVKDARASDSAAASRTVHGTKVESADISIADSKPRQRIDALVRQISSTAVDGGAGMSAGKMLQTNLAAMPTDMPMRVAANNGEFRREVGTDKPRPDAPAREPAQSPNVPANAARDALVGIHSRRAAIEGGRDRREPGDEVRSAEARPAGAGDKSTPGPAVAPPLSAGSPVVQALAGSPAWISSAQRVAAAAVAPLTGAVPVEALKIQLHPVELGVVTANLRIADGQLSIEIDVDTQDAYLKLSSERDAISRALRSTGMAVDNVTINPPMSHQPATAVRDGSGSFSGNQNLARHDFQGGGSFGQSGNSGDTGRQSNRATGHDHEHISQADTRPGGGAAGGGVYI